MGSRKTVPLRMFRIVPLGDLHISFKLNSAIISRTPMNPGKGQEGTFDASFVGGDGCTFDSDVVFLDCVCGVNCYLIVCEITMFHA